MAESISQRIFQKLKQGIIVSSQAAQGEPLDTPEMLCALAESALLGGACAIRMAQLRNIRYFKEEHPDIPLIGITKPEAIPENASALVYITPTFQDVQSIAAFCDIVALDATQRPRPNGERLAEIVRQTREQFPDVLLMADIATLEDGLQAETLGFDVIGTTLSGYTEETRHQKTAEPDFSLLAQLVARTQCPIILEGRIWEPVHVRRAFELGAFSVVIGSAVTRPHEIVRRFAQAVPPILQV